MNVRQGSKVKIKKGDNAGRPGVALAKAPGADKASIWMVMVEGKGQIRYDEKDLEVLS
jgi:hypothetical protein